MTALTTTLGLAGAPDQRWLVLGAHADDAEIGAGGTILRLLDEAPAPPRIDWVVLSADGEREAEARASATGLAGAGADLRFHVLGGRDGHLPYADPSGLKDALAEIVRDAQPTAVLAPRLDDAHQDHAFTASLAWQLCRGAVILGYEVPKWDGDLGRANLYVTLDPAVADRKVAHLLASFPSQAGRSWFTADTFRATLRLRGVEAGSPSGLAEAFDARKLVT